MGGPADPRSIPAAELRLAQVYSRGFGPHFLTGHESPGGGGGPRPAPSRRAHGPRLQGHRYAAWLIEPSEAQRIAPLKPGDGVVFDAADWRSPEEPEEGGRIFEIERNELRFGNGVLHPARIAPGDLVWRTHDPDIDKAARVYTEASSPVRKQPVASARGGARGRSAAYHVDRRRRPRHASKAARRWARHAIAPSTRTTCAPNSVASAIRPTNSRR